MFQVHQGDLVRVHVDDAGESIGHAAQQGRAGGGIFDRQVHARARAAGSAVVSVRRGTRPPAAQDQYPNTCGGGATATRGVTALYHCTPSVLQRLGADADLSQATGPVRIRSESRALRASRCRSHQVRASIIAPSTTKRVLRRVQAADQAPQAPPRAAIKYDYCLEWQYCLLHHHSGHRHCHHDGDDGDGDDDLIPRSGTSNHAGRSFVGCIIC